MLSLTNRYQKQVQMAHIVSSAADPVIPLSPFHVTIIGRLSTPQNITTTSALLDYLEDVLRKQSVRDNVPYARPLYITEVRARCAENAVRYIKIDDPQHTASISRIHCLFLQLDGGEYFVKDVNALNGVFVDNVKIQSHTWTNLKLGSLVRFAPVKQATFNLVSSNVARFPFPILDKKDVYYEFVLSKNLSPVAQVFVSAVLRAPLPAPESRKRKVYVSLDEDEAEPASMQRLRLMAASSRAPATEEQLKQIDKYECMICNYLIHRFSTLPACGHAFCLHCLTGFWANRADKPCPQCTTVCATAPIRSPEVDKVLEDLAACALTEKEDQQRAAAILKH